MKKTIFLLALCVASFSTFAQTTTLGITAGVNSSKISASTNNGGSGSSSSLIGFHAGVVMDVGVNSGFSIQPGILFSTKGAKSSPGQGSGKATFNYLEVPVNFLYKTPAGAGKFFMGGGPYLGYGISGNSSDGYGNEQSISFGSQPEDLKNPDYGLNFLLGYEFNQGLAINANYGLGLANLTNDDLGLDLKTRNQVISFSLTFFLK